MATLPTVPSFAANSTPSVATLNELAGAVNFVSQVPIIASLKVGNTHSQAITGASNVAVTWNVKECDTDGMFSSSTPTRLTAQTQGYYRMHCTLAYSIPSGQDYAVLFRQTYGSNNPNGAGGTLLFGGTSSGGSAVTTDFVSLTSSTITPCLYIGDYVEVIAWCSTSVTLEGNFEYTGNLDTAGCTDGASAWQAYYLFEGP